MSKKMAVSLGLAVSLLAGCSAAPKAETQETTAVKVMFYSEEGFYYQYGMLFSAMHPEIEIEVVSTNGIEPKNGETYNDAMVKFIKEKKPDVLMLNGPQYKQLAGEGYLFDLEARAAKDKFDLEGIAPGILEYIKGLSDGKLQGLAPEFYSQAVFYNKDLFQKYGVPLPEDRMSWESLLQLAARFPTDGEPSERIYGLKPDYMTDLTSLTKQIGGSLDLSYFNGSNKKMTANSDLWKQAAEMADKAMKAGYLYVGNPNEHNYTTYEDYLMQDPFISGKTAMSIDRRYLITQIKEAQTAFKDKAVKNWGLVTVPVDPKNPNSSSSTSVDQILAITAQSPNIEAAWKFITYVNGDEFARVKSKAGPSSFMARTKFVSDEEGRNLQAFYALSPKEDAVYRDYEKIPNEMFTQLTSLISTEFSEAEKGKQTVSEALDLIQNKGQLILDGKGEKPVESSDEAGSGLMISPRS